MSSILQDIEIKEEAISAIYPCPKGRKDSAAETVPMVDLKGSMVFPTFVDLHTHIGLSNRDIVSLFEMPILYANEF